MKYRVKVKNPNKIFIINNRPVRSPFQCFINEDGLSLIKSRVKFYGLTEKDYEIELLDSDEEKKDYSVVRAKREPDKTIKEKNIINSQKQLYEDINKIPIKQKVLIKEEKNVHTRESNLQQKPKQQVILPKQSLPKRSINLEQKQVILPKQSLPKQDIITDSTCNTEQILNEDNQNNSEIEVKIEELSIKSSSILEKFLKSEF